jgi:hypothetical protein
LKCVVIDEGLLKWMQHAVIGEPFDRRHGRAVLHDRQREAGIDAPAVDQNRARAALAVIAAFLGPSEADVLAKRIQQRRPGRDAELYRFPLETNHDSGGSS